ncbi:deoxyribose-phosphate aldolase [uncultured Subdoligranulum sp.]|uniref:deoxyribose-phosphate aldolase n=1 Tax=uncultured Subdoligranulum sp. TaxID=512298 RepID=UPI0025DB6810|nr:deoxyribose-phosphate aldolase [uncultured Subdoligranulum sp.]
MSRYTKQEILARVDHTLLKPEATWPQVRALCDEALQYHTASVCINTCYVRQAADYLAGRVPVCCVVGFPLGAMDTASKCFEARTAVENGADEVDMVINIGRLKNREYDAVRQDIAAVKQAIGDKVLKVIIETCLLTEEEKIRMCDIVPEAGADFIKTSTGFSTAGATFADIELFARHVAGRCKIKAAGGISTVEDMEKFLDLGADRLGTSRAVRLLAEG